MGDSALKGEAGAQARCAGAAAVRWSRELAPPTRLPARAESCDGLIPAYPRSPAAQFDVTHTLRPQCVCRGGDSEK